MKIDHLVLAVDTQYQKDGKIFKAIRNAGFPCRQESGKRTKGYRTSSLYIGDEYIQLVRLLMPSGSSWKKDWVEAYNKGHRGLFCLLFETSDIESEYARLSTLNVPVTRPEPMKIKKFLGMFSRTLPWRNSFVFRFSGVPLQIGFIEYKNAKAHNILRKRRMPNSRIHSVEGIEDISIKGSFSDGDLWILTQVFPDARDTSEGLVVTLEGNQHLVCEKGPDYLVSVRTDCTEGQWRGKEVVIENVTVKNGK
ncbi:VOC family protein [uncultured Sphaerochaeta sp.]|uniref:VOC family protein n=1 Tax=uncultured Sphaerochaeta sp. TaxID=886478 RepID=UPI002A0A2CC2|nr:VOC family protein [uncultured Sphaerochaeta sp.]